MPKYVPILKSKAGEYWAWQQAGPAVLAGSRPVFEIVPRDGPSRDLNTFVNRIVPNWPENAILTVDSGYLDQMQVIAGTADSVVLWTARALQGRRVVAKPVMRLGDHPHVLAEVAAAAALHGEGACLRLGSPDSDPAVDEAEDLWPEVQQVTGLPAADVDLLIDLWVVQSPRGVNRGVSIATAMLDWAHQNGPWKSVTVASGAFPESISHIEPNGATPIRRYDAELFQGVVAGSPPIVPDFGDYGIWHPGIPAAIPYRPLPNLRYTDMREWQIYRERRHRPGNESFYTLCERVVNSGHWPAAGANYSAGDAQIYRCSLGIGGPGAATQWLRWGASHHFAHVVERLTTLGEP